MLIDQKLFLLLIYAEALILVLDSLMWILDGKTGVLLRELNIFVTVVYYVLNPTICMIWYLYVDFQIYKDKRHLKKVLLPIVLPVVINLVLTVASIYNHAMFEIGPDNIYHRGRLFMIMAACAFFYLLFTWIMTIIKRKSIPKQDFLPISIFMLPVIVGGLIQTLFYGVSLIWVCATISILIIFINIQNAKLYTDHLTGLFNRRQLDRYLQNKVQNIDRGWLAGLMIDIDSFKSINDKYGHSAGDQALIDTSEILKKTFRKNDFISRYGGDEFVVIMSIQKKADLQKAIDRLNVNVALFNAQKVSPYSISLSIGYDCFLDDADQNTKAFLEHLDTLMYREKNIGSAE